MNRPFPSAAVLRPRRYFSRWDFLVVPFVLSALYLLTVAFRGASAPFDTSSPDLTVSLAPENLPYYGLRSLLRMFTAVAFSLAFTFTYATLAAKSRQAEKLLIPILDFLQSLPILGFLTATTAIFLGVFRGSLLGLEAASVFAIFTSQVWNMAFSFYNALKTVPMELSEAASAMRLSPWQRFWRLEVPFSMPGLVWNTMMSVSGGWFFVVASEVISVVGRDHPQALPGVGSYIALAIRQQDVRAMVYAGLTLLVLVLLYDQLIFRPIVAWAEKFKFETSEGQDSAQSWVLTLLQRSRFVSRISAPVLVGLDRLSLATSRGEQPGLPLDSPLAAARGAAVMDRVWDGVILVGGLGLAYIFFSYLFGGNLGVIGGRILGPNETLNAELDPNIASRFRAAGVVVGGDQAVWLSNVCAASSDGSKRSPALEAALGQRGVRLPENLTVACVAPLAPAGKVSILEIPEVFKLGVFTMLRVIVLIALAALFWVPIGVWIGLRPRVAQFVQPLAQFAAAFPANLIFPVAVVVISRLHLSAEVFTAPLMVLGTQWYILFNVIAGTIGIPNDLREAARISGVRGWAWWRTLALPAIFPALVTGGLTASGGSWNASIVAEVVSWGSTTLIATGLGAYIARWSTGEFNPHVALGMLAMGAFVLCFNRLFWRRLYQLAEDRYRLG